MRRLSTLGVLIKILNDPNRSSKIGLIFYFNGFVSYILLTEGLKIGSRVSILQNLNDVNVVSVKQNSINIIVWHYP